MLKKTLFIAVSIVMTAVAGIQAYSINGMDFEAITASGGGVDYNFSIGRTEVSFAQFANSGLSGGALWTNAVGGTDAPVVYVSWHDAARFCNWLTSEAGNSIMPYAVNGSGFVTNIMSRDDMLLDGGTFYALPTEAEWVKAAYYNGADFNLYASAASPPTDNFHAVYLGTNVAPWGVGAGEAELNGTYNMMGNVWEWLETPENGDYVLGDDSQEMVFRGGDFNSGLDTLMSTNSYADVRVALPDVGLRVVAIPEPATLSLMSLSTLGLFMTRSIRRRRKAGASLLPVRRAPLCDLFCTVEEWEAALEAQVFVSEADAGESPLKESLSALWTAGVERAKAMDKWFWNHMVTTHERRMVRRKARRAMLKKNALKCIDGFLSLILK